MSGEEHDKSRPLSALRRQAEALLPPSTDHDGTPEQMRATLHELRVHQIELELQNEELRATQLSLEEAKAKTEDVRDQFMRLFHEAPVGYAAVDSNGMLLEVNQTLRLMLGLSEDTGLERLAFAEMLQADDESIFRSRFPAFFDQPSQKRMELRLQPRKKNEAPYWVEITGRTVTWPKRRAYGPHSTRQLLIIVSDISERKRLEVELLLAAQVFEHSAEGIVITSGNGTILRVNHAFTVVTGYQQNEVLGKNPRLLKSGWHDGEYYAAMWSSIALRDHWEGEIWNRRKNGEIYAEWLSIVAIRDLADQVINYIAIFSDITERKVAEQRMEHLAHYDMLTQLPNRMLFHDRLKQALIKATRHQTWLAVMLLDLDRFKEVNDQLGHDTGDLLLQQVARRLKDTVRASDTLARLGGDEFIALLSGFDGCHAATTGASTVAANIVEDLSRPFDLGGHQVTITTSVGIAIAPQDGTTLSELIKHADTAMYSAKTNGRNNYQFFSAAMHRQSRERTLLEQGLRSAVQQRELVLLYQPMVELHTGRIVSLEVLLRWQRQQELLEPASFLRTAEESGLIVDIGDWVLDQSCALASRLARGIPGGPRRIALNISSRQLLAPERLLKQLERSMTAWGTDPSWLEVEVNEHCILQEARNAGQVLKRLKDMGLRIALDDFGTGYGSLACLHNYPIDTLKIDRSLVGNIGRDKAAETIVRSIIGLSNTLKLTSIAEGIENNEQRQFLLDNGCESGQGHFYWQPLTGKQLEELLGH